MKERHYSKAKRFFSLVLSMTIIIAMLPSKMAFAVEGLIGTDKVQIEFVPMKYLDAVVDAFEADQAGNRDYETIDEVGANTAFKSAPIVEETSRPKIGDIDFNKEYLVGIKIKGFHNITESQYGLINFTLPVLFDNNYIELTDEDITSLTDAFMYRLGTENTNNIYSYRFRTNSSSTAPRYNLMTNSTTKYADMLSIPVLASSERHATFDLSNSDFYLAVLKYKFLQLPEESGTKIFTLDMADSRLGTMYSSYFTAGFDDGDGLTVQYQCGDGASNVRLLFDVDASAINYPQVYDVTYKNGSTEIGAEEVLAGENASNIPSGSTLTAPADDKFFDNWYYDPLGSNNEDNANTVFDANVVITADTVVYAKWTSTSSPKNRIEFSRIENTISARLIFKEAVPPEDIRVHVAYKKDGLLKGAAMPEITDMTISFTIPSDLADCDMSVYVWDKDMTPLMEVQKN